jgi:hypothetical protein
MSEHPAMRQILGGGTSRIIFNLLPLYRSEVQSVLHGVDFTRVTGAKPATAGETLVLAVTGLGPLVPGATAPVEEPVRRSPGRDQFAGESQHQWQQHRSAQQSGMAGVRRKTKAARLSEIGA